MVSKYLATADPVHEISIIPRGGAGGYTMHLPQEDLSYSTKKEMFESIVGLLGGRASEQLTLDDISTGASSDIQRATAIAKDMITKYGFSDTLGPILYGSDQQEVFLGRDFSTQNKWSEKTVSAIDDEIKGLVDKAYKLALEILTEHRDQLDAVAAYLLEHEKMTGEEFENLLNPKLPEETVEESTEAPADATDHTETAE